jgi:CubicO group peptidase (beta-lactamase class C family)
VRTTIRSAGLIGALTLGLALAACSGDDARESAAPPNEAPTTTSTSPATPGDAWETVDAASVGLDAAKLAEIAAVAATGKSNCLVVARDGRLAGEWYFRGTTASTTQNVFSVTKSVSSTLVGIAQDDGDLDIEAPAATWITEWASTPSDIVTVRELLSNDSGRQWSPAIDYVELIRVPDRTAFGIGLQQETAPGTVWAYNNSAIQTLQRVVQAATGEDVVDFARRRLFDPLGMADTAMTTDQAGNAQMFQGLQTTCRDLARFGVLLLNHGVWGDEQIVSSEWVEAATGRSSTELNAAYGYLWWLNREGIIGNPLVATSLDAVENPATARGQLVPGAPEDLFWAIGLGNQVVQIDPASRTVVVRLGTYEPRPQPPTFGPREASRVVTEAVTR